jgi:hypothetical protein
MAPRGMSATTWYVGGTAVAKWTFYNAIGD